MRPRLRKGEKLTKSEQMARVRSKDTAPETILRKTLWHAGLRYRVRPDLPGTPDFALMKDKVAVFVDGCFWHGCPIHYTASVRNAEFWQKKLARNLERDRRVDEELAKLGWRIVRVWEHEVEQSVTKTVERMHAIFRVNRRAS
ncbi:MAG: very short patch repair endonuclease [Nitrospinae bacterium]|nr:very short patch repair endonuclease [Nitrospinota bacterium]